MKTFSKTKLAWIIVIGLLIIFQIITILISINLKDGSINVIDNILKLTYVENTGGAFGIGANDTISFVLISFIVIALILNFMYSQKDRIDTLGLISISLILAGGLSNLIDRLIRGAIIDYIDFSPIIAFPVFNLADSSIFIGWIILVISIVLYWKTTSKKAKNLEREIINEKNKNSFTKGE